MSQGRLPFDHTFTSQCALFQVLDVPPLYLIPPSQDISETSDSRVPSLSLHR